MLRFALFSMALHLYQGVDAWSGCPPDGPLLPRPNNLGNSTILQNATARLQSSIDTALSGELRAGWSIENTSFSIGLITADSTLPIWEYHHRGSANINGTDLVDGETQYLIGSISKLVTDMLVLRTGMNLESPITQYLPQLGNETSVIKWDNVTLASLADHLSGIPPNYGFSEWFILQPLLEQLGFPTLSPDDYANCGVTGLNGACSEEQLLEGMLKAHPVTATYQRPSYSQLSFTLLTYALGAEFNKSYASLLDEYVIQPLSLTNTGPSPGNTTLAAIPSVDNSWGSDYSDSAPGGGLYSCLHDMSRIIQSILNYTALRTETQVREWLKPHSSTSSPFSLVGRPWEIFRATNLTPAHPHTIDIYAKNGGAYGYTAQMAVIDQYGIGLAVLTAGPPDAYRILYDAMLSVLLPAVEEETRSQAHIYIGAFSSADDLVTLSTALDSGPGLKLEALTRNTSSILSSLSELFTQALPQFGALSTDFRIFPAGFSVFATLKVNGVQIEIEKED